MLKEQRKHMDIDTYGARFADEALGLVFAPCFFLKTPRKAFGVRRAGVGSQGGFHAN
jgi:hypothetical protein